MRDIPTVIVQHTIPHVYRCTKHYAHTMQHDDVAECCGQRTCGRMLRSEVFICDWLLQCEPCHAKHWDSWARLGKPKLTVNGAISPIAFADHWNIWRKCTMAKAHACTFAIARACTLARVHACTWAIVHACSITKVHACTWPEYTEYHVL